MNWNLMVVDSAYMKSTRLVPEAGLDLAAVHDLDPEAGQDLEAGRKTDPDPARKSGVHDLDPSLGQSLGQSPALEAGLARKTKMTERTHAYSNQQLSLVQINKSLFFLRTKFVLSV